MTHGEALQKLSPAHQAILRKMISEKPKSLDRHEKAALDEFRLGEDGLGFAGEEEVEHGEGI